MTALLCLVLLCLVFLGLIVFAIAVNPPRKPPAAIENPKYDPEVVKLLVQAGVPAEEIELTMHQRNLLGK